jgi:hypothetical protein
MPDSQLQFERSLWKNPLLTTTLPRTMPLHTKPSSTLYHSMATETSRFLGDYSEQEIEAATALMEVGIPMRWTLMQLPLGNSRWKKGRRAWMATYVSVAESLGIVPAVAPLELRRMAGISRTKEIKWALRIKEGQFVISEPSRKRTKKFAPQKTPLNPETPIEGPPALCPQTFKFEQYSSLLEEMREKYASTD